MEHHALQVSYFYDPECFTADGFKYGPTAVYYGYRHPMKPHRISMTHSLLMNSAYWPSLQVRFRTSSYAHLLHRWPSRWTSVGASKHANTLSKHSSHRKQHVGESADFVPKHNRHQPVLQGCLPCSRLLINAWRACRACLYLCRFTSWSALAWHTVVRSTNHKS
jgi:hypothetical protein